LVSKLGKNFPDRILPDALGIPAENKSAHVRRKADCLGPGSKKELPAKCLFRKPRSMRTILLVILVLLLIGALPTWPYSTGWGYYPSGGLILLIILVLLLVRA